MRTTDITYTFTLLAESSESRIREAFDAQLRVDLQATGRGFFTRTEDDRRVVVSAIEPGTVPEPDVLIAIIDVDGTTSPAGKLAEAEVVFLAGSLAGLRLVGFTLWAPRPGGQGRINVTFPARSYSVNGERRSFAQLRPRDEAGVGAQDALCDRIRDAYEAHTRAPKVAR